MYIYDWYFPNYNFKEVIERFRNYLSKKFNSRWYKFIYIIIFTNFYKNMKSHNRLASVVGNIKEIKEMNVII